MRQNETGKMDSFLKEEISQINSYFNGLNNESTNATDLSDRITNELPNKISQLTKVIEKTTISLLKNDARQIISEWDAMHKNRYYDAALSEKLTINLSCKSYQTYRGKTVSYSILGSILFFEVILAICLSAVDGILPLIFSLFLFCLFVAASFKLTPKLLASSEKDKVLLQLKSFLETEEQSLLAQIERYKNDFATKFDVIAEGVKKGASS